MTESPTPPASPTSPPPSSGGLPSTTVEQLPASAALLDVREDDEWAAGHAPGAQHVPLGDLPSRLEELPRDGEVYVLCRAGGRATRAAAWLVENGYDAVVVEGGMGAWAQAGRPMESASGDPHVL